MMNNRLRNYYVYVVVGIAIFMICALSRELFTGFSIKETMKTLSDCFFIPGIILSGIGGLSWISSIGVYDIFGYGGTTLISHFSRVKEKPESYYDYKQRKEAERKKWLKEALFTGLCFLVLAIICTVAYYIVE
jgi:hypothetical protein